MERRYVSIWFRHLATDWFTLRRAELKNLPFVLRAPSHGRMVVTASNSIAEKNGINPGMALADVRAIIPDIQVEDDKPDLTSRLLRKLSEWCIRFSPICGIDGADGIVIDATGCTHLWGGDEPYIIDITRKLNHRGYDVKVAIADTLGVAWAVARFGKGMGVVEKGKGLETLVSLPPEALRLNQEVIDRLHKLGLHQIFRFITIPRASLRRRFGPEILSQIDKCLGKELEPITPVQSVETHQERLPCLEPIVTTSGIEIALNELLKQLCQRLMQEQKGLRKAIFKCYRIDNKIIQIETGTNLPSHSVRHLAKLFEPKISSIEPGLGIELFVLEAPQVEPYLPRQEKMWEAGGGLDDIRLSELLDRISGKVGSASIKRYLPDEHFWPERSFKPASSIQETTTASWRAHMSRPLHLLRYPEPIEVTAPIPDYPPMLFRYKGKIHKIIRADGPERIEQEWWIQEGQHRDYYKVEDEEGNRYWLFRLGHYHEKEYRWFVHGFFS